MAFEDESEEHVSNIDWPLARSEWDGYLARFEQELYYPVFAKHNIPKGLAVQLFLLNKMSNIMDDVSDGIDQLRNKY